MPKSLLTSQPPASWVPKRALHTRDEMTNGKPKNHFIISWGDRRGHVWTVDSNMEYGSAQQTASPRV